jgi:hypothetical protein
MCSSIFFGMNGDLWSAVLARPSELFVRTFSDGDGCVQLETRVCAVLGALGIALCWLLSDGEYGCSCYTL